MSPLSSLPPFAGISANSSSSGAVTGQPSGSLTDTRNRPADASPQTKGANTADKKVGGLDEAELKQLTELKARDREVRAHEAAHQAVGGQYAGAMSFTYQRGPDGAQYAVGGEVSIDISPVNGDPQATIEKMRVVRAAAMAPAEPSGQDRAVAAQAMQLILQAQSELAQEKSSTESSPEKSAGDPDDGSEEAGDSAPGNLPRTGQQARTAYQGIAGFGPESSSPGDGFLPITV